MRRRFVVVIAMLALLGLTISPAAAVQFGELDGEDHPYVGLMVFDVDGAPSHRCTGTLLSPTVMLTAGHCTFGTTGGHVWFESDVESGIPANGYPFGDGTSIDFATIDTHPDYVDAAFFLFDVGIVTLSQPVVRDEYGVLADIGLLDELSTKRGKKDLSFTVVGYGLQSVKPTLSQERIRYQGTVKLVNVNGTAGIPAGTSAIFTNNPGGGNGSGGTCFGDSGGPIFHGDSNVIAAVTSFGLNQNCAGTGGGYRVDTVDDQNFINSFFP